MSQDFIFRHSSWFDREYAEKLDLDGYRGSRAATLKLALDLFMHRGGNLIVETGCQRGIDDWGAGCSTQLFVNFTNIEGGIFISVDINPENIQFITDQFGYSANLQPYCMDSVEFFEQFSIGPIDLLYLDSHDYPIVEMCDLYGPREDYKKNYQVLDKLGEKEIVRLHGDIIYPSQLHCKNEIEAALLHLTDKSIIVIDDSGLPGGGKARLARQVLLDNRWICLLDAYQTVWVKENF